MAPWNMNDCKVFVKKEDLPAETVPQQAEWMFPAPRLNTPHSATPVRSALGEYILAPANISGPGVSICFFNY
jgi:hypothetical protein